MGRIHPETTRIVLSLLQEAWDDESTPKLNNAELAAVLELWMHAQSEDSSLLRCVVERLRTAQP